MLQYLPGQAVSQVAKYFPNTGVSNRPVNSIYLALYNSLMTLYSISLPSTNQVLYFWSRNSVSKKKMESARVFTYAIVFSTVMQSLGFRVCTTASNSPNSPCVYFG